VDCVVASGGQPRGQLGRQALIDEKLQAGSSNGSIRSWSAAAA
jgi:hypothetical protein